MSRQKLGRSLDLTTDTQAASSSSTSLPSNHDPPLMPLFTPVLQDFQNRYGSSILEYRHSEEEEYEDDHLQERGAAQSEDEAPNHYHDDHDNSSDQQSLLFHGIGGSQSHHSPSNRGGARPSFAHSGSQSSSPFSLNRGLSPDMRTSGSGGVSRAVPSFDLGTDHEAPPSLMIEMNQRQDDDDKDDPSPGRWSFGDRARRRFQYKRPGMDAAELAMWKWVNVENLDNFLGKVYDYYVGKGMYTILLERCLNLLTFAFVIGFSTFVIGCVDHPNLRHSKHLSDVLIPQCVHKLSTGTFVVLLLFATFWVGQLTRLIYEVPQMMDMCNFYTYLLQIPDEDIQTVSWHEVVARIIRIRDNNPNTSTAATIQTTSTQRLNAHDIANRIMRKENFLIAMFNKELIDLRVPLPLMHNRTILTRILEWSLGFCIIGYVFDERGQVRKRFLKDNRRGELVEGLRRRFQFMGLATLLFSPLISIYLVLYFFFRYFEEYHKNPSSIGTRQYTPLAKWKFKEFNELPHLFEARINASYPLAMKYINQFPKEKTILVCRFVAFISGSFAAVLALITLFDQELLLGLEITSEKTVIFYLGLFGTIMAVSRGMIPDQTETFDPELLLQGVVEHTHYLPSEWRDKLHTDEVRKQFALLFEYNVMLFALEFMSLVMTPLVLCLTLPNCSEKVVDFFREFTVHVDGVGYVCSFAVFDFQRHGNVKYGAPAAPATDERFVSNEGKMEKSFINFKQNNPEWEPKDPAGSMFLSKLMETDSNLGPAGFGRRHRVDPMQSQQWGQTSAYLRPRRPMDHSFAPGDRAYHVGKSRLGHGAHHYRSETDSERDASDEGDDDGHQRQDQAGVKFYLSSRQQRQEQSSHRANASLGIRGGHVDEQQPEFRSTLGDSFVSEIGASQQLSKSAKGKSRRHKDDDGHGAEDPADSDDNERDSQKKGVFGLLNQIYEMNNVTM